MLPRARRCQIVIGLCTSWRQLFLLLDEWEEGDRNLCPTSFIPFTFCFHERTYYFVGNLLQSGKPPQDYEALKTDRALEVTEKMRASW